MNSDRTCQECGRIIPDDSPGGFCGQCLLSLGLQEVKSSSPTDLSSSSETSLPSEKPGDRIGRYRLLEEIGQGGCGVVYMAEQEQPVRRKVALKVIKLGMDTKQVVARFQAERQALALMDHPHIARVLDAGATETGRPYFVMELVGGIKITDFCDQNDLPIRQRLELFIQVCRAIQHAHQKGIIHRDIKPSNVLVAIQDGVPVPKVIDFGIAKATQGRLTDQTLFTAFEHFLGTPAYMSPEQTQLGSLDVDTRSDIYSLGVLLYELLTGKTPFDTKELMASDLDQLRRTIREVEPMKPSTRLTQELVAAEGRPLRFHGAGRDPVRADSRRLLQVKQRIHLLRGDLDWIVMKCLEKDRARRYETANGLASDVERHLSNEPVVARPPSKLYEFQKTVRRHKFGFAATAAVIIVLGVGTTMSTLQAVRAVRAEREQRRLLKQARDAEVGEAREREQAETEAAKSQQVAQFLEDMVSSVGPSVAAGRDTTLLREILDHTAGRLGSDLENQPQVVVELQNTIGRVYTALGEAANAEKIHRRALAICRERLGEDQPDTVVSLLGLAQARGAQRDLSEAEALDRQALAICRKLFPEGHQHLAYALNDLSRVLLAKGEPDEAEVLQQEALEMQRRLGGDQSPDVALSLRNMGIIRAAQGRNEQAEALMTEGLAIMRKVGTRQNVAWSIGELAKVLEVEGKLAQAEDALKETLAMQREIYGQNHPSVMGTYLGLGDILAREGKVAEAETHVLTALAIQRQRPEVERTDPSLSFWIGSIFQKMGKLAEAEEWYRQALYADLRSPRLPPRSYTSLVHALVTVLNSEGKSSEIEDSYAPWLQGMHARSPSDEGEPVAHLLSDIAVTLLARTNYTEGEQLARECLAMREKSLPDDWRVYRAKSLLGGCLLGQRKYAEAEPVLLSAYEGLKRHEADIPLGSQQRINEVLQRLAQLYEATGRPGEAAEWTLKLRELERIQSAIATNSISIPPVR